LDTRAGLILLLSSTASGQQLPASLPELDHYTWGFPIETAEPASLYRLQLPLLVNQSAADADLRDCGVYNASGQAVPRVFEPLSDAVELQEQRHTLPFVAVYREQLPDAERIRMTFEQMDGRTRIDVQSAEDAVRSPLSGYIVDTRAVDDSLDALEFAWPPETAGFIGHLSVEASDNLENWQALGGGAVADLREGPAVIEQRRLGIKASDADFLRLTWTDLPPDFRLDSVTGLTTTTTARAVRQTLTLDSNGKDVNDGGHLFELGGMVRVDQVGLSLPEINTVVAVDIYAWMPSQERWIRTHRGSFHHIRRGEALVSSGPVDIRALRAARWKAVIHDGHPDTQMQLQLGWRPDSLLFVAQGAAPFTLAIGRDAALAERFPQERLLGGVPVAELAEDNGHVVTAVLGERFPLDGKVREMPRVPVEWRTIVLWAALVLAVLFVAALAIRLMRGLPRN
jgi:hypothetical protein